MAESTSPSKRSEKLRQAKEKENLDLTFAQSRDYFGRLD